MKVSFDGGMSPKSDYELAQAVSHGVVSSIGDLYERHSRMVYTLCLRMTGDVSQAEDLTQDIFIQLLRKVGTFRGDSQFGTWLYRLTVNQVLMHFRRASRRRESPGMLEEFVTTRVGARASTNQLADRIALNAALAKVPSRSRAIFIKFDLEGYNHDEIARIFGCSVGNSKSQLHKARRKLRKLL